MGCKIDTPEFVGPLDLLLHLIKQSNISINEISIDEITKQYLNYINLMEEMNLNVASEYLVMAAELIEIKSSSLLPKPELEDDEFEEDPKEKLINKLLEYEKYKSMTNEFRELEDYRHEVYTKDPDSLLDFKEDVSDVDYGVDLNNLLEALSKFLDEKELDKPLNTKVSTKEYSVGKRSREIKDILKLKKKICFKELFKVYTKEYVVVTFLAILSMSRNQEIEIVQENNFNDILIKEKGAK